MFDLDDISTPVSQHRGSSGYKSMFSHFQNAHAFHYIGHGFSSSKTKRASKLALRLLTNPRRKAGVLFYWGMLKDKAPHQTRLEMVTLEELVPQDHLLRLIDRHIDFSFIHDRVKHLYSADNGRPAVDPTMLFKMLFIGYLFGVRSERQLIREIQVNVAYRWFIGLGLTDKVIDASTFSQNRRRRFDGTDIEQVIFDEIVEQAIEKGLVAGEALYTDSTHLKANANKRRHTVVEVNVAPMDYL